MPNDVSLARHHAQRAETEMAAAEAVDSTELCDHRMRRAQVHATLAVAFATLDVSDSIMVEKG